MRFWTTKHRPKTQKLPHFLSQNLNLSVVNQKIVPTFFSKYTYNNFFWAFMSFFGFFLGIFYFWKFVAIFYFNLNLCIHSLQYICVFMYMYVYMLDLWLAHWADRLSVSKQLRYYHILHVLCTIKCHIYIDVPQGSSMFAVCVSYFICLCKHVDF